MYRRREAAKSSRRPRMTRPGALSITPRLLPSLPASATTTTTTAAVAWCHRASLVYGERAPIQVRTIKFSNRIGRFLFRGHFNKTEAFAAPRVPICDDPRGFNLSCLSKHLSQAVVSSRKRQISNIKFVAHITPLLNVIIQKSDQTANLQTSSITNPGKSMIPTSFFASCKSDLVFGFILLHRSTPDRPIELRITVSLRSAAIYQEFLSSQRRLPGSFRDLRC
jgi:hypothetical protein